MISVGRGPHSNRFTPRAGETLRSRPPKWEQREFSAIGVTGKTGAKKRAAPEGRLKKNQSYESPGGQCLPVAFMSLSKPSQPALVNSRFRVARLALMA